MGNMNIFEAFYIIGVFVAFVLLLADYIILNLRLGVSINSVFVFLLKNLDSVLWFIFMSLGSWLMVYTLLDKIKNE